MNPEQLVAALRSSGVTLWVDPRGVLKARGSGSGARPLLDELSLLKDSVVVLLQSDLSEVCPRCREPAVERFYGPCSLCRAQLRRHVVPRRRIDSRQVRSVETLRQPPYEPD